MGRTTSIVSLSLSMIALGLAGLSLVESRSTSPKPDAAVAADIRSLTDSVARLEADLEAEVAENSNLRSKYEALARPGTKGATRSKKIVGDGTGKPAKRGAEGEDLEETVALLRERLNALESGETIHLLAQTGKKQVTQKRLRSAVMSLRNHISGP